MDKVERNAELKERFSQKSRSIAGTRGLLSVGSYSALRAGSLSAHKRNNNLSRSSYSGMSSQRRKSAIKKFNKSAIKITDTYEMPSGR